MVTLALGIGANTTIFGVVNAVMLQRMPFESADRLVMVWEQSPSSGKPNVVNPINFLEWRARNHSFEQIAAFSQWQASLAGEGEPEQLDAIPSRMPAEVTTLSSISGMGSGASERIEIMRDISS